VWLRRLFWLVVIAALIAGGGWGAKQWLDVNRRGEDVLTATSRRGDLVLTVVDRGELESAQSVQVMCEVEGGGKIVTIVPEGTRVKKGDEVARFDTNALQKAISEQDVKWETAEGKVKTAESELEVQKNKAESEIAKADLALKLAQIDYESYEEGEYKVELDKRKGARELGRKELKEAEDNLVFTKGLVKKGFAQLEQIRVMELNVDAKMYAVSQQDADLMVLEKFTRKRKETELKAKFEDAQREFERTKKSQAAATEKANSELVAARKTAGLESHELARLREQLEKCVARAPEDGVVIYYTRYWDEDSRIRPGLEVHYQQPIISLPDLDNMQVKLKVHESVVKKVLEGQTATMQIEALSNQILHGKVRTIASVAQNEGWRGGGVKEYQTEVSIDDLPRDAGLRPGMTADVRIHIKTVDNALSVPVQAVTELDGKHVAYVVASGSIDRQEVTIGESNEQLVQILSGLAEGVQVALDARSRAAAELKLQSKGSGQVPPEIDKPAVPTQPKDKAVAARG
jgi:HlyD family secretion protein